MDPPTHALFGAALGAAFFERRLGKKALVWGAAAAVFPDVDILFVDPGNHFSDLLYHRGFTHALWFGPVVGGFCGVLKGRRSGNSLSWILLLTLALISHPFLDVLTTYGTQLLAPFSSRRFSLDAMPIIDPIFSLVLFIALLTFAFRSRLGRFGPKLLRFLFGFAVFYLFAALFLNFEAKSYVRKQLTQEGVVGAKVNSYPTLFQIFLRRITVETPAEIRVGFLTLWNPAPVHWTMRPVVRNHLVDQVMASREGRVFSWFTSGALYAVAGEHGQTMRVEIHDLRYGFGAKPEESLWGITADFDAKGTLLAPVERFRRGLPVNKWNLTLALFGAAFGKRELP